MALASRQFLNVPMFRNVTLKCLTEIAGVSVSQYEEQFVTLFTLTMCQLKQVRPIQCLISLMALPRDTRRVSEQAGQDSVLVASVLVFQSKRYSVRSQMSTAFL